MEYNSPEFRKWLDKLQQESWQLELIISGFAIYGLISASEPIASNAIFAMASEQTAHGMLWAAANIAVSILILNLISHVVLRGLWIGAIGLRYVSGEIDYNSLNYSEKFTSHLKKKVGSFDKYIAQLENFCSILFALSFLILFYILAFFAFLTFEIVFIVIIGEIDFIPKIIKQILLILTFAFFALGALLVFIDFIGQGILKKKEWTSKLYFPFYKIFSILTLSFLYRPIVYNFLDNKFSRRLSIYIVPFYIGLSFILTFDDTSSNYISNYNSSSESYRSNSNYEDSTTDENHLIQIASIPSTTIQTSYLKVFLLYKKDMEDFIFESNESLKPENDARGMTLTFIDELKAGWNMAKNEVETDTILPLYLKTLNKLYSIEIDNISYKSDFLISKNNKKQLGFETYLNIKNLPEGKHLLKIKGQKKKDHFSKDSETVEKTLVTIPFWYFPENSNTPANYQFVESDSLTNK